MTQFQMLVLIVVIMLMFELTNGRTTRQARSLR